MSSIVFREITATANRSDFPQAVKVILKLVINFVPISKHFNPFRRDPGRSETIN